MGFPCGASAKEPICQCRRTKRHGFHPRVRKIPWRRAWQLTPVFLPRKSHRQRSLVGYSPQDHKELDTTEATQHAHQKAINDTISQKPRQSEGIRQAHITNRKDLIFPTFRKNFKFLKIVLENADVDKINLKIKTINILLLFCIFF